MNFEAGLTLLLPFTVAANAAIGYIELLRRITPSNIRSAGSLANDGDNGWLIVARFLADRL